MDSGRLPPHVHRPLRGLDLRDVNGWRDAHGSDLPDVARRSEAVHIGSLDAELVAHVGQQVGDAHAGGVAVDSHELLPRAARRRRGARRAQVRAEEIREPTRERRLAVPRVVHVPGPGLGARGLAVETRGERAGGRGQRRRRGGGGELVPEAVIAAKLRARLAALTSGGGGAAGAVGLATAAIMNEDATHVVTVMALQQYKQRLGTVFGASAPSPENSFLQPSGLVGPGHLMSVLARRHMHLYGTTRDAFAEIVISQRENALNREGAMRRTPLTKEEYFASPMLADPLCRLDFCLETDGAVAWIATSTERARDLKQKPVLIHAAAHGGQREWGRAFAWMGMPDPHFGSSGHKPIGDRLWQQSGLKPADMDVALIYDHFSAMVLMQLEDYGFCEKGEGNDFVLSGAIRYKGGSIPVNTHGGQLSEAYIIGATHTREAVEQLRGVAVNQVDDAEFALVTGGPASLPVSGCILRRA